MILRANKFPVRINVHLFNNDLQKHKTVSKEISNYRNILLEHDNYFIIKNSLHSKNLNYKNSQPKIHRFSFNISFGIKKCQPDKRKIFTSFLLT